MSEEEVLSGEELDALMESVSNGDVPLDESGGENVHFDFSSRTQMLLVQMPALRTIADKQALELLQVLEEQFKIPLRVTAGDTELTSMGETWITMNNPSAITLIDYPKMKHTAVLTVSGDLLSFFLDHYFGGGAMGGKTRPKTGQALTPTEKRMNNVLVEHFLTTQKTAWTEYMELDGSVITTETNPDFLATGSTEQMVIAFNYTIGLGDWESTMSWIVPYAALEPIRSRLSHAILKEGEGYVKNWEQHLRKELNDISLTVSGVLATTDISISRIMGLKAGDVLPLNTNDGAVLCAENTPFAQGEHGAINGSKSVKITDFKFLS